MDAPSSFLLSGTISQLAKYFDARQISAASLPELEQKLTVAVHQLLRTNLERLLQILYRMDVEEQQVRRAFRFPSEEDVAATVAQLIIKRELQRMQTRFTYNQN